MLKTGEKPICGIFAFLNGLKYKKVSNKGSWHEAAKEIWSLTINSIPKEYNADSRKSKFYSLVGEFFSYDNLNSFLNDEKNNILVILRSQGIKIDNYTAKEIYSTTVDFSQFDENAFYIIPINTSQKGNNIMHWICLRNCQIFCVNRSFS